jgi:UDP-galactopyranose mutase
MKKNVLIVGAGFSGAVLARELAEKGGISSLVIDERQHIAGNCHTARDENTGIMIHEYGPHIFHTSRREVWEYVCKHALFMPFTNRVKATIPRGVFSLPINLHTINQFFKVNFSPDQARAFIASKGDITITNPTNFEEQALRMIGSELYEAFFKGYTIKQWGCQPTELPASILKRIPIRFNYDDNYYNSSFQGIPQNGYTELVASILNHPLVEVKTGLGFEQEMGSEFEHIFYTGPIDRYYNYVHGRLGYRSVFWERIETHGDYQGNAVINYPDLAIAHTRIHEHKHFAPWETHEKTLAFIEYSKETTYKDTPYYPKRLMEDMIGLSSYINAANSEEKVSFLGRLATYRYMDMHQVIGESLDFSTAWLLARREGQRLPVFPSCIH